MTKVDVSFRLLGGQIPVDHGYLLYSALSRALPAIHEQNGIGVHPIRGQQLGGRTLQLGENSRLVIRTDVEKIGLLLPLAGKSLVLLGGTLRVGVPEVRSLIPATAIRSRLVTIKPATTGESGDVLPLDIFLAAVRRKLDELSISSQTILQTGKRRTLRIKDKEIVGYEVLVEGLTAEESIALQESGLGGRRHMGCGVFMPAKKEG